jgi:hypothetical protein
MILSGIPIVYVGYYIAIRPSDWIYGRGAMFAIGIFLMVFGVLGIILDYRKTRRRRERAREKSGTRTSVAESR